eukprot:CAMPEP_0178889882 /NCGR_PEP_ID=MMETSP0747-20121128/18034_1 /TAXON_ID=913974 /ORGANISM="Nitzschia punctata, Strain CCMP561" /LENGTH=455 /DNA_ID=CAMNT_0020559473 /DNA_START=79 /DNA_END=1447 /DNA_ORIENTATION=-
MKDQSSNPCCHFSASAMLCLAYFACSSHAFVVTGAQNKPVSNLVDTTKIGSLDVPTVGVGTISWSSKSLFSLENEELEDLVAAAYRSNAAFFDTAERYGSHLKTAIGLGYGETERLTNKLLQRATLTEGPARVKPVVASKFTPLPWRTSAQSVVDACEESRRNLGVESIDLYQIHMPDSTPESLISHPSCPGMVSLTSFMFVLSPSLPFVIVVQPFRAFGRVESKDSIYWDGLAECYHRGIVKNVGVCNYGPTLVEKCHEALAKRGVPLASNQIAFSLIGRQNGSQETVDKCNELGVKCLAYYPFAMGLLTGKYSREIWGKAKDVSINESLTTQKKTSLELLDLQRYAQGDGITVPEGGIAPLLNVMLVIAEKREKTLAQVALNYIISKGVIPIPGCRTSAQLEDNLGAMGWRLTSEEIAMLEFEADKLPNFDGAGFKRTNEKFVGYGIEKWVLD